MHPNPAFRKTSEVRNLAFARARSFGVLILAGPDGPLASHIPFLMSGDGRRLEAHLVRSNPILRAIETPQKALVAVSGPDGYISPDWYGIEDQVPTWNYVAVHLRGEVRRLDQAELAPHTARLSAQFEARLAPKPPWTDAKMTPDALARLQRMIVPIEMTISEVSGTWKLNQNKPDAVRHAAARAVSEHGIGSEMAALSALMDTPPGSE